MGATRGPWLRRRELWWRRPRVGMAQGRRGLALCLVAASLWVTVPAVAAAASISSYRAQEASIDSRLAAAQAQYSTDMAAWDQAQVALRQADASVHAAATKLSAASNAVAAAQARLAQFATEVAAAQAVVTSDTAKADQGMTTIYEHGTVSFVDVLFGAASFSDFLTRLGLLKRIWNLEVGYLQQAEQAQMRLQALEAEQRVALTQRTALRAAAAADLVAMQQQVAAAALANTRANADVTNVAALVNSLATERDGLQAQIRKLLAELASGKTSWSAILQDIHILAGEYGIDPLLVEAVVLQESGGQAGVKSTAGAMGLMQLMPGTAAGLGVTNAYNPVQNLRGGITYLLEMLHDFHGNLALALAAYNAGPYAVQAYGGIPPYQQTQNYVNDVLSIYNREK